MSDSSDKAAFGALMTIPRGDVKEMSLTVVMVGAPGLSLYAVSHLCLVFMLSLTSGEEA